MRTSKTALLVALLYQIYRGTVFTVATLVSLNASASLAPTDRALLIAASAASLVPAVLLLQLYLTGSRVLLPPARIAKLLESVGSILAVITISGSRGFVLPLGIAAIGDVILFAFLLLYPHERGEPGEEKQSSVLPAATIEDLEDE